MQCTRVIGLGQRIFWQGKMVHAYFLIAHGKKSLFSDFIELPFPLIRRQIFFIIASLASPLDPGNMGITVKGDTIWSQFSSQINRALHGRLRLVWKTKHQIMADRLIPYFTAHLSDCAHVFERLNAVDGLLYNRIIILDTETISGKSK